MSRSLISLAIVRTNWDRFRKDHVENFVPLVATLIVEKKYTSIGPDNLIQISKDFQERFGINLPTHPLETVLKRMSKEDYLDKSSGEWKPVLVKLEKLNISGKSKDVERKFNALIESIQRFAKTSLETDITAEEVEEGLLSYLSKHDLDILFASNDGSILPPVKENKKLEYIVGSYIKSIENKDPDSFQKLIDISVGHALASTMLYDDINAYKGKLKDLEIYFDTPWLFDLLGIRGEGKQKMAIELLEIAKQENAARKLFEVNKGEVITNLDICLEDFVHRKHPEKGSRTYKLCKQSNISESDIRELITTLEDTFKEEFEMEIDTVPDFNEKAKFQIDENELYDLIVETYDSQRILNIAEEMDKAEKEHIKGLEEQKAEGDSKTEKPTTTTKIEKKDNKKDNKEKDRDNKTILRDVRSLSGIYRLREGNSPRTLKECKALFVTTNASLALASRRFEIKQSKSRTAIPSCITDSFLGTLIWLTTPDKANEITKKKLIADCYALTEPDQDLIKKYLEEVDRLKKKKKITGEQHLLLRTDQSAFNILTSKAYGDVNQFSADLPIEILEQIQADLEAKARGKVQGEMDEKDAALIQEKKEKEGVISEKEGKEQELKEALKVVEGFGSIAKQRASSFSKIIINGAMTIVTLIIIFFLVIQYVNDGWTTTTIVITSILGLLTVLNLVFGFYFYAYAKKLIPKLEGKIYKWLTKGK